MRRAKKKKSVPVPTKKVKNVHHSIQRYTYTHSYWFNDSISRWSSEQVCLYENKKKIIVFDKQKQKTLTLESIGMNERKIERPLCKSLNQNRKLIS